ncbi:MAG: radical SAM protein [Rhodocyclaceae bacterium]|nr:radical SAM protein [Rhodocyclaceae bacterium]
MLNLRIIEGYLKGHLVGLESAINRWLGRQFIPRKISTFNIETSSACNLKCRFCAYEKKATPRLSMSNELFRDAVEQAVALGFREFHLTPTTGDVFMDKRLFDKLAFLESHPLVESYHFFTNLTIPSREKLLALHSLRKLSRLTISIYGHDEASFVAITQADGRIYERLIANLETILERMGQWPFPISVGFRSTFDVPETDASDLMRMLSALRRKGVGIHASHGIYNNWGGMISQADVEGLNLRILPAPAAEKIGPCVKLFDAVQVMATGVVNACSCRDANATLKIGDLREQTLGDILSPGNAAYLSIIEEQEAGQFRPVCRSCDYYRSIYHQPTNFRRGKIPVQSIDEYFASRSVPDTQRDAAKVGAGGTATGQ